MTWQGVYNCLLVGKKSSGRGSFVRHHIPRDHVRSPGLSGIGVVMHPLIVNTSVGTIQFNVWDVDDMHGECLVPTDCVIVFESVSNDVAVKTYSTWQTDLVVVIESIKLTVACSDEPFNSFGGLNSTWMERTRKKVMQLEYYNLLSLESPHNVEKVFLWLSRKLVSDKKIEFFSYPVFLPRFFIKARKSEPGICCHCFCVTITNEAEASSSSSSASTSSSYFLKEDSTERKGGGDSKDSTTQSKKNKSKDEADKKDEIETSFVKADAEEEQTTNSKKKE